MQAALTALKGIALFAFAIGLIVGTMLYIRANADRQPPIWLNHDGMAGS